MHPSVDYDTIADAYDQRYRTNDYSGVEQAVMTFVGQDPSGRVLEVGCGTGHWLHVLGGAGMRVVGLDASIGMLTRARTQAPRAALVHGVAEALPWRDHSFDRLYCVHALHHFRDPRAFVTEARRVLRPGGQMMTIGLDPHTQRDRWYVYEYFEPSLETDQRRCPAARQIQEWMNGVGFDHCVTREVQHLPVRFPASAAIERGHLAKTASSQLSLLTDEQYQQGMDRLLTDIASEEANGRQLHLTADLRLYATFGSVPS